MAKKLHTPYWPSIINVDGVQLLVSETGELIKGVVWTDVFDPTELPAIAVVKMMVNIGHPDEEAIKEKIRNRQP